MTEEQLAEYRACLSLRHCPKIGPRTWGRLLQHYGNACDAVEDVRSWMREGLANSAQVESYSRGTWREAVDEEHEAAKTCRQPVLLYEDSRFPELLRQLPDPPLFLYYQGHVDLLHGPAVAVVGSRNCSGNGRMLARRMGAALSRAGLTVVSGMAWGIDREAHIGSLDGPGASIAVLGTGLDQTYPAENADIRAALAKDGLIISEFAPGTRPVASNFPYRNRIVSGLSLGVVVVEAASRSGSRITARMALEQGRDVYAVSGPDGQASFIGCHELIEEGARPVSEASEVVADLAPHIKAYLAGDVAPFSVNKQQVPQQAGLPLGDEEGCDVEDFASENAEPDAGAEAETQESAVPCAKTCRKADGGEEGVSMARGMNETPSEALDDAEAHSHEAPDNVREGTCDVAHGGGQGERPECGAEKSALGESHTPDEACVLALLQSDERVHIDAISRKLDWDAEQTSSILLLLEIQGEVRQWPGMEYSLA